jgi:8-oxo-dGTP diphosphatase
MGALLSTADAAREIGISERSLARWAREGRVRPAFTTPKGWLRWDMDDLRRQLAQEGAPVIETARPEPQPVVAAVVTNGDRLLVTWRHDKTPPAGFLSGEIEPGESPADAMVREVKEESGLRVVAGAELGRRVHPKTQRTMIYVAGQPAEGADVFVGDAEELADVRWVTLAEADEAFAAFGGMFGPVHEHLRATLR